MKNIMAVIGHDRIHKEFAERIDAEDAGTR